ncbi:ABC transporter substrate-binding protein [Thiospirochaeta perfilievii]|uniref:ABC transporter substrate-binding protein n=1 Tax=Thiospirochaeta perfilievii TaxID=252967 RepID=A0A5C1Q8D9_9SPIO|nr:ABC transporter substrate-binding protein [Thiospirochaeta perfilievii]QEN03229.1 ABC transporter substrate-binding protein [Thiospirochaeta perfilievii]
MKKFITLITLLFTVFMFSCKEESTNLKIGISKIVAHPALDAIEQGIIDTIKKDFPNAEFDLQNANGDMGTATQIANKFKMDKVDLAIGIATPTAMALVGVLEDIPVVYSAVTDPVSAGIVSSLDKGEIGVAGVSDMTPVASQIELLNKITPIKRLGHIYNSGEANGVSLKDMAKKYCEERGIEFVEAVVTNTSEVKQAALSIMGKVDGLYLSNDNTIFAALPAILELANENRVPVMTADPQSALDGDVFAAMGFDQYKLGVASGKVAVEVLNGKDTTDMPTVFLTNTSDLNFILNLDVAKKIGITIPKNIIELATTVIGE